MQNIFYENLPEKSFFRSFHDNNDITGKNELQLMKREGKKRERKRVRESLQKEKKNKRTTLKRWKSKRDETEFIIIPE